MMRRRIKFILLWIALTIAFLFLAIVLLLEAYGYRYNPETRTLQATGVIIVDGQPRPAELLVNGISPRDSILPVKLAKLLPGRYDLTVEKDLYQTWSKSLHLSAGQAIEEKYIQLFLAKPEVLESSRKITLVELQKDFANQGADLVIQENEIWYQEKLITRFSKKPANAILTNNRHQVIFQLGREIQAMDIDGTNNVKLFSLPSTEAVAFALYGNKIIYAAQDKFWEAEIK